MEERIGVFICNCGNSLKNIDFPWLQERTASLQGVAYTKISTALCLKDELESMLADIRERQLSRIVVAGCSPQFKGQIFSHAMEQAELASDMVSWLNLREQCSWAHSSNVSEKALSLMRMAVSEVKLLRPARLAEVVINQRVLIIGGGFSGLSVAVELSRLGIRSTIVEKEASLGGQFKDGGTLEAALKGILYALVAEIAGDSNIEVVTSAEVTSIEGTAGDFVVGITKGSQTSRQTFGAIVVAVGRQTGITPEPTSSKVVACRDIARLEQELEGLPRQVAFLTDASGEHSRMGTLSALAGAVAIRQRLGSEVYIFSQNLKVDSKGAEKLYREAREKGVTFVKFDEKPEILSENGRVKIKVRDVLLKDDVVVYCNLLITGEEAGPSQLPLSTLGIRTDDRGFYQEVNPHLFPSLSGRKGVLLVGSCRADLDLARASLESTQAALKVYELLNQNGSKVKVKVYVDPDKCRACLTCLRICPHSAIGMERESGKERAHIYELACDACGECVAICPAKAIEYEGYTDEQIIANLQAIGEP